MSKLKKKKIEEWQCKYAIQKDEEEPRKRAKKHEWEEGGMR